MPASRPRRSTATSKTKYNAAAVFAELIGDDSPSSSEDGTAGKPGEAAAAPGSSTKKRKRPRTPSSESESDGSQFALDQDAAGVQDGSGSDSDSSDSESQGTTSARDEVADLALSDGGEEPESGSDIVDMSTRPRGQATKLLSSKASASTSTSARRSAAAGTTKTHPGTNANTVARKGIRLKSGGEAFWSSVVQPIASTSNSRLALHEEAWGFHGPEQQGHICHTTDSSVEPLHLRSSHHQPANSLEGVGLTRKACLSSNDRRKINAAWRHTPFAPTSKMLQDVDWFKGKTSKPERWGGWYAGLKRKQPVQQLDPEQAISHFPWENAPEMQQAQAASGEDSLLETAGEDEAKPGSKGKVALWIGHGKSVDEEAEDEDGEADHQILVHVEGFTSLRLNQYLQDKPGHVLNAGGPVWTLDWAPQADILHPAEKEYLAIGTMTDQLALGAFASNAFAASQPPPPGLIQIWSLDVSRDTEATRSVSKAEEDDDPQPNMVFEFGICLDVGQPWKLKWCPRGGHKESAGQKTIGILAGVFTDGKVHFFDVPKPNSKSPTYIKLQPILSLSVPGTSCTSIDWSSHERVVVGCDNGFIAVWDVAAAFESASTVALRPSHYFQAHQSAIKAVTSIRTPPQGEDYDFDDEAEPHLVASGGFDGSCVLTDLRDVRTVSVGTHVRYSHNAMAFQSSTGCAIISDAEDGLAVLHLRPLALSSVRQMAQHHGAVWDIATSPFHPFVASASADGTVFVTNSIRKLFTKHVLQYSAVGFKMDFNRHTGQHRMVDNPRPELQSNWVEPKAGGNTKAAKAKRKAKADEQHSSGAWLPEVGVLSVSWGKSLHRGCLLATGTQSGLVRVDWVEGPELSGLGYKVQEIIGEEEEEQGDEDELEEDTS